MQKDDEIIKEKVNGQSRDTKAAVRFVAARRLGQIQQNRKKDGCYCLEQMTKMKSNVTVLALIADLASSIEKSLPMQNK